MNTILDKGKEELLSFQWKRVFADLQSHMPCLIRLLQYINPQFDKLLISVIVSMMTKFHNDKLSVVQQILSIFLYGNSVHKEVC